MFVILQILKHIAHIRCCAVALMLAACSAPEKPAEGALPAGDSTSTLAPVANDSTTATMLDTPTETFEGTYLGKPLLFSHKDFQKFTFKEGDQVWSGAMNTEKGYGDDRSATVYVLNSDKPKAEQKYIVRSSNGSVYLLDQDRFVVDDAAFNPVKMAVAAKPAAKPAETKQTSASPTEAKAEKSKPAAAKKSSAKKKVAAKAKKKKAVVAKKAPAKKSVKAKKKKKKKAVRKARKKNSTRKTTTAPAQKEAPKN